MLPYCNMVIAPHKMVRLERMSDYRGVGLERFHCIHAYVIWIVSTLKGRQNRHSLSKVLTNQGAFNGIS